MYFTCHFCPRRHSGRLRYFGKRGAVLSGFGSGVAGVSIEGSTLATRNIYRAGLTTIFCSGPASPRSYGDVGLTTRKRETPIYATVGSTVDRSQRVSGRFASLSP